MLNKQITTKTPNTDKRTPFKGGPLKEEEEAGAKTEAGRNPADDARRRAMSLVRSWFSSFVSS